MEAVTLRGDSSRLAALLQRWASTTLERCRNEQGTEKSGAPAHVAFDAAAEAVRRFTQQTLLWVAYDYNSRRPMAALPLRPLRRMLCFVDQDTRWALSQTCRSLRACCLSTASLWRTTVPRYRWQGWPVTPALASRFSLLAQRSLPGDLDFRGALMATSAADVEIISALLTPVIHRLRFIAITSLIHREELGFKDLLETPAPVLEEALLAASGFGQGYPTRTPPAELPSGLFAGSCSLRALELRNIRLPAMGSICPALSGIRSFNWEHMFELDVDTAIFCHILTLMPRLEVLSLSVHEFSWSLSPVAVAAPCRLRSFTLYTDQTAANIVRCLRDVSSINRFYYLSGLPASVPALLDDIAEHEVTAHIGPVTSELSVPQEAFTRQVVIRGDVRALFGASIPSWDAALRPTALGAGSLTRLSLHEFYWPGTDGLPPFPRLVWLRIALASCFAYRMSPKVYSDSILAGRDVAAWDAPLLEAVVISHVAPPKSCRNAFVLPEDHMLLPLLETCFCARRMLPVCLSDVHRFVSAYVLQPGQRLSQLSLEGMEAVDLDPWAALESLQDVAHDVTISSVAEPMGCDWDFQVIPDADEPHAE